jgi:carbonic anhydrase
MPSLRLPFVLLCSFLIVGCIDAPESSSENPTGTDSSASPAWSYQGETGPEEWADLSDEYATCDGDLQSPIDLGDAESPGAVPPSLELSYSSTEGEVVDTGHSLQVNTPIGELTYNDTSYELLQFHLHAPSEHTIDGEEYAAELHLVHRDEDKDEEQNDTNQKDNEELAVIGVLIEVGDTSSPAFEGWTSKTDTSVSINPEQLIPADSSFYTYRGSLTTPPCTESVRWIVMDTPLEISKEKLEALREAYSDNDRPVQPVNDRQVVHVTP